MSAPGYTKNSIGSISALAKSLGLEEEQLLNIAKNPEKYIFPNSPIIKENGDKRYTYRVVPPLKKIHTKILQNILRKVEFPEYIQGGVRDSENPRSYITDAALHTEKRVVIAEDIHNFFPSIDKSLVRKMWQHCFHFPPNVSEVLADLTTYQGALYQGAKTSTYIANLIFWDKEPQLVKALEEKGLKYSRYLDDISISSERALDDQEKTEIIAMVYGMLLGKGLSPNRSKHSIGTRRKRVSVHGLTVNARKPSLDRNERDRIRAAVKECEREFPVSAGSEKYQQLYNSTLGRVRTLKQLHPRQGERLLALMDELRP